ncbi:hypothetical protein [Qipengyuania qiaonensis]|uniref:Uncharacterized protein n=1 Tax=Qipengyuania qiaonensis TaxID=2867240 RepID=A0ABS7J7H2_9SPHN|nr:hypothetical protein [Qipengyuania qiaonensis]MBX7483266.1 hypothetical protein [Qipengyuania qiaonensis]
MRTLLMGAAAIALAASGAYAEPGKGNNNKGNGKNQAAAQVERGKADRGAQRSDSGKSDRSAQKSGNAKSNLGAQRPDNGNNRGKAETRTEKRVVQQQERSNQRKEPPRQVKRRDDRKEASRQADKRTDSRVDQRPDRRDSGQYDRKTIRYVDRARYDRDRTFLVRDRDRSVIDGCPPGLAKKYNGCMPPGQAKQRYENYRPWNGYDYRPRLFGLTNYSTGRYYYDDGYLLRPASNGLIAGYIPLLGGALAVGNPWPSNYNSYAVPDYYVDYYDLGPASSYRYADNVIYRVDPSDAAIISVAALLTGNEFVIGQSMPQGYDVYNVPYAYRDRYYDTSDASYRYSDGYVYQIDPETQLISAAIDLLI